MVDWHPVCALHKTLLVQFCRIPGLAQRLSMLPLALIQLVLKVFNLLGQLACRLSMRLLRSSCMQPHTFIFHVMLYDDA